MMNFSMTEGRKEANIQPNEKNNCWRCGVKAAQEAANGRKAAQEVANEEGRLHQSTAVKMEAYVSPTMGNVKERKVGFKEKVFMVVPKSIRKDKTWNGKLSTKNSISCNNKAKPKHEELQMADSKCFGKFLPSRSFNTKEECWSCGVKAAQEEANGRKAAQEAANGEGRLHQSTVAAKCSKPCYKC
ncbi:hypothetical protein SLEP1_g12648 [Rubroshorea leprosula]|uniref:Uncharacterized protein n=1 Tax=Rubroshorea leprosula TaxID=152421 RepID=A0AAV5ILX6_9ROSI|nr:hypothetical protein SLEP1_g12648 [Rubroshorea leprosula]